jgi:hypothetical protein
MRLVCDSLRLLGDYGTVLQGEEFECPDESAMQLIRDGKARRADAPKVLYDTKVIGPETPKIRYETKTQEQDEETTGNKGALEVSDSRPFRNGALHHEEPASVAPEVDPAVPDANVPEQGTPDRGRRRRRERSGSR